MWYHAAFVFLCLTYFTQPDARSTHVTPDGKILVFLMAA